MKVLQNTFSLEEIKNITPILLSGELGFGPNVEIFENEFKKFSNQKYNLAVNSASAAAFMVFAYLKEKYGVCEIYTPSLAFTSPVWAAKHFDHKIVWVDINDELLFDCNDYLEKSELPGWREKTGMKKIVMPILYGGVSTIDNWKLRGDEIVVIDAAHCPTPTLKGDFTFYSFHPTKPICTSDGGLISTDIEEANEYFKKYRNFGRINTVDGYNIIQNGFKFYMNNLNATIGLESLKKYKENLDIRKENYIFIQKQFEGRFLQHDSNSSYYFATLLTDKADELNQKYSLAKHYPLLHKTEYYGSHVILPNTEKLHKQIVNLPLHVKF
jgi:perosamine synthetase